MERAKIIKRGSRDVFVPIVSKAEFKLLKAMFFIAGVIGYGLLIKFSNGWWATIVFAVVLAMYLREIYGRRK